MKKSANKKYMIIMLSFSWVGGLITFHELCCVARDCSLEWPGMAMHIVFVSVCWGKGIRVVVFLVFYGECFSIIENKR
jgi:hypothetical protein